MNREALLIYLKDLRDMEVAKWKVNSLRTQANNIYCYQKSEYEHALAKFNNDISFYQNYKPSFQVVPFNASPLCNILILLIIGFAIFLCVDFAIENPQLHFWDVISLIFLLCFTFVVGLILFFIGYSSGSRYKAAINHNQAEEAYISTLPAKQEEVRKNFDIQEKEYNLAKNIWQSKDSYYASELTRINDLLSSLYGINYLAFPYRNLASLQYIVEYMLTSPASFDEVLQYERLENGIQRIESRLDTIISQNEKIILLLRSIESGISVNTGLLNDIKKDIYYGNQRTAEQNSKILEACQSTAENSLEAAYYSKIAANYERVNAFFASANYFER